MVNKLIKTKKDYSFALSRIDELMDAKAGTPEADELELLATLVEMYEDKHYPMDLPDPIEAIKFRMEQLGLNQQSLVPFIGSRSKVSEVLNRKRPLTLAMMRALHKSLGISSDVLLQEPGRDFPGDMTEIQWSNFPLSEMAKRGWIQKSNDLNGKAEEIVRDFIEQAGGPRVAIAALFRRSAGSRQNSKMDTYALCAWCLRVLSVARKNPLKNKFKDGSFNSQTLKEIAKLSYFQNGPSLAKEYLEKQGTHLIIIPHLSKTYLDGAAMLLDDGTPVVGLTLRYDRVDNFWFCLLHELAHVAKHLSDPSKIFIDDLDLRGHEAEVADTKEKQADEVAQNALIPNKIWENDPIQIQASARNVIDLSERLKIHPAIIAGRIRFERRNYKLLSKYVGNREIRKHFRSEGMEVCA
jgi:HTH-type transcriptional regulator/antitoxin HigA